MRIAVVGAGAIGTWLGAALARAGHEVALIARRPLPRRIRVTGTEDYEVQTADPSGFAEADYVVLAVKAHDQAGVDLTACGANTPVLAVQNGIPWWYPHGSSAFLHPRDVRGSENRRIEAVDPDGTVTKNIAPERAIGAVAYLGATLVEPGTVAVRPEAGLVLGEPSREHSERLTRIADALAEAGFPVRLHDSDIRVEIWTKLMGNASFNPISLLTRRGLSSMATHPPTRELLAGIMREIVAVASALNVPPQIDVDERLAITARLGDHRPSTLQDFEAGKPVELAAIVHAPLELARHAGVDTPLLAAVAALTDLLVAAPAAPAPGG